MIDPNMEELFRQVAEAEAELEEEDRRQVAREDQGIQEVEAPQVRRSNRAKKPVERLNLLVTARGPGGMSVTGDNAY